MLPDAQGRRLQVGGLLPSIYLLQQPQCHSLYDRIYLAIFGRMQIVRCEARQPEKRTVEHARHLAARVASAIADDALHRQHSFVVEDAIIVGPGDGPQLDATVCNLERLHPLGTVRGQAVCSLMPASSAGSWRR